MRDEGIRVDRALDRYVGAPDPCLGCDEISDREADRCQVLSLAGASGGVQLQDGFAEVGREVERAGAVLLFDELEAEQFVEASRPREVGTSEGQELNVDHQASFAPAAWGGPQKNAALARSPIWRASTRGKGAEPCLFARAGADGEAFVVVEDSGDFQPAAEGFDVAAERGELHLAASFDA